MATNEKITLNVDLYDNIRGFDLKGSYACHIADKESCVITGSSIIKSIKVLQLFFFHTAFFKEVLDFLFIKSKRLRDLFMLFDHFSKVFVDAFYNFILAVFTERFLDNGLEGFLLASCR